MRAHQLARLALGCYIMNGSRQGKNVLWFIETTSVVEDGCRKGLDFAMRSERRRRSKKKKKAHKVSPFSCYIASPEPNGVQRYMNDPERGSRGHYYYRGAYPSLSD